MRHYLQELLEGGAFRFDRLTVRNIDNGPVFAVNAPDIEEQETCLFHQGVTSGDQYIDLLHGYVSNSIDKRTSAPVVRFADGEYAFYRHSLECNGLYQQAESVAAIKVAIPAHLDALRVAARAGKIAPLVFPGNTRERERGLFSFLRKSKNDDSAIRFLDFLSEDSIELTGDNYIPFYAVYAYLVSGCFARLLDGKSVCVVNAAYDEDAFRKWFEAFSSRPLLSHAPIPDSYVATRWDLMRETALARIPAGVDVCLVGAGIGALQVCVDIAERFFVPAIDAGHVMNMMNGRVDKSGGPRLYTIWKTERQMEN